MVLSNIIIPQNDYIGTESCMEFQNSNDMIDNHVSFKPNHTKYEAKFKSNTKKKENKVFPPPIPLLARTQNLASHMPWVLKRYYTSEGRLILKEEKVKHHEYFHAHRANGRLTLQLVNVPLYDYEYSEEKSPTSPHEDVHIDHKVITHDHENVVSINDDRLQGEGNVASVVADEVCVEHDSDINVVGGSGIVQCLSYNSVRTGPACIFGVPVVHPIRTVQG